MSKNESPFTPSDLEENFRNVQRRFEMAASLPGAWQFRAAGLLAAARILYVAYRSCADGAFQKSGTPPSHAGIPNTEMVLGSVFLEYGFALENEFKALALAQGQKLSDGDELAMPKAFKGHRLDQMANATSFAISGPERDMLEDVSQVIRYAGRYPVACRAEDHRLRQRRSGGWSSGVGLQTAWVDMIEALILRLDAAINEHRLKP